ncbi:MAG: ribonuclease P protein subunit [archaeon]|nr:ribonuclease P protein subunit [archaeon]
MIKNYEINEKNLMAHEMNGLKVEVINSSDKNKIGIKGIIVSETKNTFIVESKGKEKIIPKKETEIMFFVEKKKIKIKGEKILEKPENRIKMFWRKFHGKMQ